MSKVPNVAFNATSGNEENKMYADLVLQSDTFFSFHFNINVNINN